MVQGSPEEPEIVTHTGQDKLDFDPERTPYNPGEKLSPETRAITPTPTPTPTTPLPLSAPVPQYLSGGTAKSYLLSGDAPTIYPGSTAFVYEKIKIKITDNPETYATSLTYSLAVTPTATSTSGNPTSSSAPNMRAQPTQLTAKPSAKAAASITPLTPPKSSPSASAQKHRSS